DRFARQGAGRRARERRTEGQRQQWCPGNPGPATTTNEGSGIAQDNLDKNRRSSNIDSAVQGTILSRASENETQSVPPSTRPWKLDHHSFLSSGCCLNDWEESRMRGGGALRFLD
ncbi:hypothetical protein CPAR01_13772, partial [Colletotrichum paranaense]